MIPSRYFIITLFNLEMSFKVDFYRISAGPYTSVLSGVKFRISPCAFMYSCLTYFILRVSLRKFTPIKGKKNLHTHNFPFLELRSSFIKECVNVDRLEKEALEKIATVKMKLPVLVMFTVDKI